MRQDWPSREALTRRSHFEHAQGVSGEGERRVKQQFSELNRATNREAYAVQISSKRATPATRHTPAHRQKSLKVPRVRRPQVCHKPPAEQRREVSQQSKAAHPSHAERQHKRNEAIARYTSTNYKSGSQKW